FPTFLADGRHFIYHRFSSASTAGMYVGSIDVKPEDQSSEQLVSTPFAGAYVPALGSSPAQLLFMRDGTLVAQPFDDKQLKLTGEPVPIAEALGSFLNNAFFSVSANGVLIYRGAQTRL